MLFIACAIGIVGGFVLGLDGLVLGAGGQLERVAAVACFALGGAGLVGILADDGEREPWLRRRLVSRATFELVAATPIIVISAGAFVATLIPSLYVALPFLAMWWYRSPQRREARGLAHAPALAQPAHVPAYA